MKLLGLVAVLVLVGCGGSSDGGVGPPSASIAGTYVLRTINLTPVPQSGCAAPYTFSCVVADTVALDASGGFTESEIGYFASAASVQRTVTVGTYAFAPSSGTVTVTVRSVTGPGVTEFGYGFPLHSDGQSLALAGPYSNNVSMFWARVP